MEVSAHGPETDWLTVSHVADELPMGVEFALGAPRDEVLPLRPRQSPHIEFRTQTLSHSQRQRATSSSKRFTGASNSPAAFYEGPSVKPSGS